MTVLLVSGSTRARSTNTAVCRTAAALDPSGTSLYLDLATLPAFDPDRDVDPLPEPVARLRGAIAASHAILFCTPEYAGSLPGAMKNLLDWTVGGPVELYGMPVAWFNVASVAAPTGGLGAHGELATVLGYVNTRVVEEACRRIPLAHGDVGGDGLIGSADVRRELAAALAALTASSSSSSP